MKFAPLNFGVIRSPVLPHTSVRDFMSGMQTDEEFFKAILALFRDAFLERAIYVASLDLYEGMCEIRDNYETLCVHDKRKVEKVCLSLFKYYIRMSTRATPYGLFSGCQGFRISDEPNSLVLDAASPFSVYNRMSMRSLNEVIAAATRDMAIERNSLFKRNSSLYKIHTHYYYVNYTLSEGIRNYRLNTLERSEVLDKTLDYCTVNRSFSDILDQLKALRISESDAAGFIHQLVEHQLLINDLEISVLGEDPLTSFCDKLKKQHRDTPTAGSIQVIKDLFSLQDPIDLGRKLAAKLAPILPGAAEKDLLQSDLFLNFSSDNVNTGFVDNLLENIQNLLPHARHYVPERLQKFRDSFVEKYGPAEKRLVEVLDPNFGLGYGIYDQRQVENTTLVGEIPTYGGAGSEATIKWGSYEKYKLDKFIRSMESGSAVIDITDEDLRQLSQWQPGTPSFDPYDLFIHGSVVSSETQFPAEGHGFVVYHIGGNASMNLLGRFCHGSPFIRSHVSRYIEMENKAHGEAVFAEVTHLPQARLGNILARPAMRDYEIPYLSNTAHGGPAPISIEDLWVSVENEKILLKSKGLGKFVIPKLTSAHNFSSNDNLPIYAFLCDLQYQTGGSLELWKWGVLESQKRLPRVIYKNVVLAEAKWTLEKGDFSITDHRHVPESVFFQYMPVLRVQHRIARFVKIAMSDNQLPLDLDCKWSLRILLKELNKFHSLVLLEEIQNEGPAFVRDAQGKGYNNEFVLPLVNRDFTVDKAYRKKEYPDMSLWKRDLSVNDCWFYVKIYCGVSHTETILLDALVPFIREIRRRKWVLKWFFIRYGDPDNHIRFRIHFRDIGKLFSGFQVFASVMRPLVENGLASKYILETYSPELERYGAHTMAQTERLFNGDSEAAIALIKIAHKDSFLSGGNRWILAIKYIDSFLSDFQYTLTGKRDLMKILSENFIQEFSGSKEMIRQINKQYQENRAKIGAVLHNEGDKEVETILAWKSRTIRQFRESVIKMPEDALGVTSRMPDYIHLFMNRFFRSNWRKHEMLVYTFLYKYYNSSIKISENAPPSDVLS